MNPRPLTFLLTRTQVAMVLAACIFAAPDLSSAGEDVAVLPSAAPVDSPPPTEAVKQTAFQQIQPAVVAEDQAVVTGTRIKVPIDLEPLHRRGGVPASLDIFRLLEKQQKLVAERATKCTVGVRIGPAQGCGVIITDTGYIVTAAHVATEPSKVAVITLQGGRQVKATSLGMNKSVDAGLMKINPGQNNGQPWPHASLGHSDNLVPGMWCIAMGHPGGYEPSRGAVVRVGRLLEVRPDALVSDCALIGGDSGGSLFNMAGELIGVHSRIGNRVSENLHVPIDHYDYSWDRMSKGESWGFLPNFRPTVGVVGNQTTPNAVIKEVKAGSPAERAGMRANDVVVSFGKRQLTNFQSLKDAVSNTMPGQRVRVIVRRIVDGKTVSIDLTIEVGRSS